ncbi:hypothetical protein E3P77_03589 [Wallemia ichthyophaga]|nr:hypothetical protein E3P77_03589 [Wallemia ichthyophaga]
MMLWRCCWRRRKDSNDINNSEQDERTRLLDNEGGGTSGGGSTYSPALPPATPSYSRSHSHAPDSHTTENDKDTASLNDIVSKASEQMVNITNSNSSLKAATSIHSLRDLNCLSNWLQGDPIKLDKATDREQELIKDTASGLAEVFENAFDFSLSQSNSEASSRRGSMKSEGIDDKGGIGSGSKSNSRPNSINNNTTTNTTINSSEQHGLSFNQRRLSLDEQSMHEEFENTPRQTLSSTPRNTHNTRDNVS